MTQPWRDVYSTDYWEYMSKSFESHPEGSSINNLIDSVTRALKNYHSLKKNVLVDFPVREGTLLRLADKLHSYCKRHNLSPEPPDSIGKTIHELLFRTNRKAFYLKQVRNFFPTPAGNQFPDPMLFISYLKARTNFDDFPILLNKAFGDWINAIKMDAKNTIGLIEPNALTELKRQNDRPSTSRERINIPFLVWMEDHEICTGDKAHFPGAAILVDKIHLLVPSPDGLIKEFPVGANKSRDLRIFDTKHLRDKENGMVGYAAYVWTRTGELLAGAFQGENIYKPFFVGSANVRCAGMIEVVGGKVQTISTNSVQSMMGVEKVKAFAEWLKEGDFLSPTCMAAYWDSVYHKVTIANLFGSNENLIAHKSLDDLNVSMKKVVQRYEASDRGFFRRKSEESKKALIYLKNDFPKDIITAKLAVDPFWNSFPVEVIRALLGEGKTFAELLKKVGGGTVGGKQRYSLFAAIATLKRSSTMRGILLEEFRIWEDTVV